MNTPVFRHSRTRGFSMIEVLVSLLIVVLGLLGLAGLQVRMQQAELESYQRAQAVVLLQDMVDRIAAHRLAAPCFRITDPAAGTPFLGTGSTFSLASCVVSGLGTSADETQALAAMTEWNELLQGAAEIKGGAGAGAMIGARGCISYDATTELLDSGGAAIANSGIYTVAISWQGTSDTFAPTVNCANGLYGTPAASDTRRRTLSMTFRHASLGD